MMLWGLGLLLLFVLPPHAAGIKESGVQALTPGAVGPVRLAELLKTSARSRRTGVEAGRRRTRRSVFMHSGVRICPQETISQVLASHQAYYQLRVCQEAVWEAFRIFLDRIPGTTEYQRWVHTCQHESLCISDLAKNFSSSDEHMSMVQRRMSRIQDRRPPPPPRGVVTPAPPPKLPQITGPEAQTFPPSAAPPPDTAAAATTSVVLVAMSASPSPAPEPTQPPEDVEEDSDLPNVVPEGPVEQTVEFSIDLVDPGYRELLDDRDSPQYVDLAQHLQDQMHHAFDKLPGFKAIHVLGISETQDTDGPGGISVHYSLVFDINSPEMNSEDSATETGSPRPSSERGLREMVTKALREEASLPIDLNSLSFEAESVLPPALTSTSSAELVNESSEPDSHNEFEVVTEEPEVDKPRLVVPLTPLEKENALVTLLDPTAVPDDDDSDDGLAAVIVEPGEGGDQPPVPDDITDESEAISESQPEPSNQEEEEEELLIFSHKIETIHHSETGELVRDYVLTPPTIIELETDAPYISLSPNLLPEEDRSPVDKDDASLNIVQLLATTQMVLTPAPAEEEFTTLADTTEQPPTQPITVLKQDEAVNALPDEEEEEEVHLVLPEVHDPGVSMVTDKEETSDLEAEVEPLEPEKDLDVLEILEPTPEQIEVFVPEVLEESEEEVVAAEPEEKDEELEVMEVSEAPPPPESKPESSEVKVLKETEPASEPKEEIVAPTEEVEELEQGIFEVLYPSPETDIKIFEGSEVVPEEDGGLVISEVGPEPEEGGVLVDVSEEEEEKVVEPARSEEAVLEAEEVEDTIYVKPVEEEIVVVPKLEDEVVESQKEEEAKIPEPEVIQVESPSEDEGVVDTAELKPEPEVPEPEVIGAGGEVGEDSKAEPDQEVEVVEVEVLPPELKPEPGTPILEVIETETEVVEAPKPEQDLGKDAEPDEAVEIVEPEPPVPEVTKTGVKVVEDVEMEQDLGKDVEPSEVFVIEVSPEPEPEEGVVEGVKPEEEVVILPMPEEEPVDVSEPEPENVLEHLPQEPGEDIVEDVKPEGEVVVVLGPEEEPVDIAEPELPSEPKEEVVVDLKPEGELVVVPLPEEEPDNILEPELPSKPEDISEPELPQEPEEEVLVDLKPEEEVVVVPLPEVEPEDILEPELSSKPEEEVITDLKPEGEVLVVPLPEEEPEDISEPEIPSKPEEEVITDLKPEGEVVVVPLLEEEPEDILEPELSSKPEEEVITDLKPEGEVVVVPLPEEEPEDISEPEIPSKPQDISEPELPPEPEEEEVVDLKPEGEIVVVLLPEEEPVDISEPEHPSESEDLVDKSELQPDKSVAEVLPPAEDLPGILEPEPTPDKEIAEPEPEPEAAVTEPPAESIKILRPLDGRDTLYFGEDTLQVVEESDFLQPVGPDQYRPFEDNLPVVPIDIQRSPETPVQEKPVINDLYILEDSDGVDVPEEGDVGSDTTSETALSDLEVETTSGAPEATAPEKEDRPEATEDGDHLSEETPESDSSPGKDARVTVGPVSHFFPTPPATSFDVSEVASPRPTIDTGLFEVAEESGPASLEDEMETEPSVIIIDEDLDETVEDGAPSRTDPPFTAEDVIVGGVQDLAVELDHTDVAPTEATELPVDEGSGLQSAVEETTTGVSVTAPPPLKYVTTPYMTTAPQGRELVVFFSLRVTNMNFSDDLFNKTSSEYRTLENTFLDVLLPFLQANLTGFRNLEILNFRKGSVVVNSRMKFASRCRTTSPRPSTAFWRSSAQPPNTCTSRSTPTHWTWNQLTSQPL
ncbi:titin-like [Sphaeramia orbicularis]|uniref:titin-like n=1 Tax=Sphaeramia orbicularis TaxID=375764 RepID=UPI00117D63BE|nr:titin-like [Sphaeramia orbicularis]